MEIGVRGAAGVLVVSCSTPERNREQEVATIRNMQENSLTLI